MSHTSREATGSVIYPQSCVKEASAVCSFAVSWSDAPLLNPLLGEMVVEDTTLLQCNITGLTSVSCATVSTDGLFNMATQSVIFQNKSVISYMEF